jgi:patatin-like phospholipase/acyl hydrolase
MRSSCSGFLSLFLFTFLVLMIANSAFGGDNDEEGISHSVSESALSDNSKSAKAPEMAGMKHSVTIHDFQNLDSSLSPNLSSSGDLLQDLGREKHKHHRALSASDKTLIESAPLKTSKKIFLLSLDGGGIRGIIHAHVLARFEDLFKKRAAKIFSAVSGASTGALVGVGIGIPDTKRPGKSLYSAQDILGLYLNERGNMFEKQKFTKRVSSVNGILGPRYNVAKMEATLKKYFGGRRMSDLLIPTFVPAVEVFKGKGATIFSSAKARLKPQRDYWVWEVARATTAAPSFFESKEILEDATGENQDTILNFWDGGLFAHNPAEIALMEAQKIFPKTHMKDFVLVSIGTGERKQRISQEMSKNMGFANGGGQIFTATMSAQNSMIEKKMKRQLGDNYIRLQVDLDEEGVFLDNLSASYLERLYFATEKMLDENLEKIMHLKDIWDIQRGRKMSRYDLLSEAQVLISKRYSIPLENKTAIHKIYQDYCLEHQLNCDKSEGVKKVVRHMRSQPILQASLASDWGHSLK